MTDHTPGFPPELETAIAQALMKHRERLDQSTPRPKGGQSLSTVIGGASTGTLRLKLKGMPTCFLTSSPANRAWFYQGRR